MLKVKCQGGERHVYHFSSLPQRAFEALLTRVLDASPPAGEHGHVPAIAAPLPRPVRVDAPNATPPWVLPLMRIVRRQGAHPSISRALQQLPKALPAGVACPSHDEAMQVLRGLGVAAS